MNENGNENRKFYTRFQWDGPCALAHVRIVN